MNKHLELIRNLSIARAILVNDWVRDTNESEIDDCDGWDAIINEANLALQEIFPTEQVTKQDIRRFWW